MSRHQQIEDTLRQRILAGIHPPGSRIPTQRELQDEFAASPVTVQQAIDGLVGEGFLVARGGRGTYVNEHPPHQATHALVFAEQPGGVVWNRYWSTLLREGREWRDAAGRRFDIYVIRNSDPDCEDHRRLCRNAAAGALAGVVFTSRPFWLERSPILQAVVPRVVLGREIDETRRGLSIIDLELSRDRLWAALQRDGRRRLAVVSGREEAEAWRADLPGLRAHGIATREEWWIELPTDPGAARSAERIVRLLLSGRADERPDALLIGDDNLVTHATAGIVASGLVPPADLSVLAHANFPGPTPAAVRCRRFGPDVHALLRAALDELARLRQPGATAVNIRFAMDIRDEIGARAG